MGALFQFNQTLSDLLRMRVKHRRIDFHAVALNPRQDRHQRHLDIFKDIQRAFMLLQLRPHLQMQLQRHVSILRGVTPGLFQRDLIKGELIFTFAGNLFKSDGFVFQPAIGQAIHIMSARDAVEGVGFQHGVEGNTTQFNVVVGQDAAIVLQVLPYF